MKIVPNVSKNLMLQEKNIKYHFTKSLFSGSKWNDIARGQFQLPARYDGLATIISSNI